MIETHTPGIDVDELMEKVRAEAAQRANQPPPPSDLHWPGVASPRPSHLQEVELFLNQAARVANIGTTVPAFAVLDPIRRRLAQLVTPVLLYFLQVITVDQRVYNRLVLDALRRLSDGLEGMDRSLSKGLADQARALEDLCARLSAFEEALGDRDARLRALETSLVEAKRELVLQRHRVDCLLEEVTKRGPAPLGEDQLQVIENEAGHRLDALVVAVEERFRGSREEVKERLRVHLPAVREAKAGSAEYPILDIGCGRGEWLDLLREEGLVGCGVDTNRVLVGQCQERGLAVVEADGVTHLRRLPDESLGAVTAFHLVEHLPTDVLSRLLDEAVRALRPGGVLLLETPNPANVLVGSCMFYLDPTHCKPLPSPLLHLLLESRGLTNVKVTFLHPYPTEHRQAGSDLAERFSDYFYGPQDYAVIGYKG